VDPRAGLDMLSKRKIPSPRQESKLDHPTVQPVASRYGRAIVVIETAGEELSVVTCCKLMTS
jgi:hypothetical protein